MSNDEVELINANDWLESTLNERKRLLDIAPKLFKLLLDLFEDDLDKDQGDTEKWVIKTYWEIIKRRIEGFSIELTNAKQDARDYSLAEEFEALKADTTRCLEKDHGLDIRETWERLDKKT